MQKQPKKTNSLRRILGTWFLSAILEVFLAMAAVIAFVYASVWLISDALGMDLFLYLPDHLAVTTICIYATGLLLYNLWKLINLYINDLLDRPEEKIAEMISKSNAKNK